MEINILTLFPDMFRGMLDESILKRAQENSYLTVYLHNIRDYSIDKHQVVDDYPYGGGAGMVMKPDPIFACAEAVHRRGPLILLSPQGKVFNQQIAQDFSKELSLTLLCGHYEGVDERVIQHLVTHEISIGDYILTGGEIAAMVIIDAVTRLIPGVLGSPESPLEESHTDGVLEYPHYTRPPVFRGWPVPETLLSGNHAAIARWRRKEALRRTLTRRPDLLIGRQVSDSDRKLLEEISREESF